MTRFDYDLVTIGAGSGGVRAARLAASYGAKAAVIEEYRVGGTCVIRGCVPKKLLVYASRYHEEFEDAAGYGWHIPHARHDWAQLIAAKDREIARLEGLYRKNLGVAGANVIEDRAVLLDRHRVKLVRSGETISAKTILIATGAASHIPPEIEGRELAITSNEAFHLSARPQSILVVGAGYIAVEFAGIFHGLGAKTHLAYRGDHLLRGFDRDIRERLTHELGKRGIDVRLHMMPSKIQDVDGARRVTFTDGSALTVDCVMFATGRLPNTVGLGLERAGVVLSGAGAVMVDAYSQTSVENIYAVGDVTNRVNLTPVAIREGAAFAETVFNGKPTKVDHTDIATAVFSTPEIGVVGLTEEAARAAYPKVDIYKTGFRPMKATLSGRDTLNFMKLVVDGDTDRVLGCHMLGEAAGEVIQAVAIAVKMKATKADFDATIAVHPTMAEELVLLKTKG